MQKSSVRALAIVASCAVPISLAGLGAAQAGTDSRAALAGSQPSWAHSPLATAPSAKAIDATVYLSPRHQAQLDALVAGVSDPTSAQYRHFLSPAQYRSAYAPSAGNVTAVRSWLTSAGLRVTGVGAGNRYLSVHGSVAQAEQAFGTKLDLFRHNGKTVQAPSSAVTVPSGLAGIVSGVSGLDEADHIVKPATTQAPPPPGFKNARPCSTYYGQLTAKFQADFKTKLPKFQGSYRPYAVCGYTPVQFRAAYEGATKLTGAGATVAITDAYAAPTIRADADTYAKRHGDQPFRAGQFTQVRPGSFTKQAQCGPSGWYGEETLDVEAVHGMAPDAKVIYYASKSCFDTDFIDTLARVVDDNKASIVSNSWGDLEQNETAGLVHAYQAVFKQGAVQGIGFFFSSGDSGDELARTGLTQTDYPTSDPYVTSVGGTSLAIGATGNYQFEAGWGTTKYSLSASGNSWDPLGFIYGAGGGFSHLFNRPAYQRGVVNNGTPGRAVPDIAMDADPTTGMLVGETQTFPNSAHYGEYRIGGTSLASPLMAGIQALATQKMGRLGFANPRIYSLARTGSSAYRDVTQAHDNAANIRVDYANGINAKDGLLYSVRTFDDDSSLNTTKGWDDVTGVGSPKQAYFTGAAG